LPLPEDVFVTLGQEPAAVKVEPTEQLPPFAMEQFGPEAQLYRARFSAHFEPGETSLTARYRQPLASAEAGRGYFSEGKMVPYFRYELWPLKSWRLEPGFRIGVTVSLAHPAPRGLAALFGEDPPVRCTAGKGAQKGDRYVVSATLGADFPERFHCTL
jgi:hypothetical protein